MEQLPGNLKNNNIKPELIPLNALAHLGDAVYELYIRQQVIQQTQKLNDMHNITTSLVNSHFQAELLESLKPQLTESELDLVRRGRNASLTVSKKKDQAIHRISTGFEALIGYYYLSDENRLKELFTLMDSYIEKKLT